MLLPTYFTVTALDETPSPFAGYATYDEAEHIAEKRYPKQSYQIDEWNASTGEHIATTALLRGVVNG